MASVTQIGRKLAAYRRRVNRKGHVTKQLKAAKKQLTKTKRRLTRMSRTGKTGQPVEWTQEELAIIEIEIEDLQEELKFIDSIRGEWRHLLLEKERRIKASGSALGRRLITITERQQDAELAFRATDRAIRAAETAAASLSIIRENLKKGASNQKAMRAANQAARRTQRHLTRLAGTIRELNRSSAGEIGTRQLERFHQGWTAKVAARRHQKTVEFAKYWFYRVLRLNTKLKQKRDTLKKSRIRLAKERRQIIENA